MKASALVLSGLLFVGVLLVAPAPLSAHDELVSSNPANGATVRAVPSSVLLVFEEPPAEGQTKVAIYGPNGADVSTGPVVAAGSRISRAVRPGLGAGTYTVRFSVLSDDGHPVSGTVRFTVAARDTATAPAVTPTSNGGSDGRWAFFLIGGLVALVALYLGVRVLSPAPSTRIRG